MNTQMTAAEETLGFVLPTRKVESFHYTDLRRMLRELPQEGRGSGTETKYEPIVETHLIAFSDGTLQGDQILPSGVIMSTGAQKADSEDINDAIVSLNAATAGDALEFVISGDSTAEKPLGLGHVSTQDTRSGVYHKVTVKAGSQGHIIERHTSPNGVKSLSTSVSELIVEEGGKVVWYILQQENEEASHLARLNVTLAQDAELSVFILNAGGKLVRQEVKVAVIGENANLAIRGVNLVGDGAHIDVTTVLEHNVPHTNAEELFRNVVAGDGHGIFQGQIKVAQPAQKTDAQMACNTLLLTDEGDFSAKPELEIFADDVICAHGATVTDIDDDHKFYLKARGIDEKTARSLLIKAFVDEVVEELEAGEVMEEALTGAIDAWLDQNI
ncbi:MAG: Fe-S cluster assembly protein SufD [Pseudomonadota bacterium]